MLAFVDGVHFENRVEACSQLESHELRSAYDQPAISLRSACDQPTISLRSAYNQPGVFY